MSSFQTQSHILIKKMATLENFWRLSKFKPNDEQRKAILQVDGPLYLTAGPARSAVELQADFSIRGNNRLTEAANG